MDKMNRPEWDEYYLSIAFAVARRSFDPSTKCGCVIVSENNRPLSMGYNGPISGSKDENIPLTRPEKYRMMIHAEVNALLSYCGSHQDIVGSTCYVTSRPCHNCLRSLIQKGIHRIVHGTKNAKCLDPEDIRAQQLMLIDHPIEFRVMDEKTVVVDFFTSAVDDIRKY